MVTWQEEQGKSRIGRAETGGALINLRGEVIGISEGGYGASEGFQGIGFAIPVNAAMRIARQLMDQGYVRRAYLSCYTQLVTARLARHIGLIQNGGLTQLTQGRT